LRVIAAVSIAAHVTDAELVRAIHRSRTADRHAHTVVGLRRTSWEYATSASLELVSAAMDDGSERRYVLKHLGARSVLEAARRAKPSFVVDPRREIEVYRRVLAPLNVGPRLIGSRISPATGSYWLLTEHVTDLRLFEVGDPATWTGVARWLGELHKRLTACNRQALSRKARLLQYNREWYTVWLERALRFFADDGPMPSRRSRTALEWLAERYHKVVERLLSLPQTVIHGEFYPSNVLVAGTPADPVPCPVDWEMAAIGPGVIDLAALTSGEWRPHDRRAAIAAYVEGSGSHRDAFAELAESVEYAYVYLAVQWLGWFGRRRAPAGHLRDWLAEAADRAEALRL
jgi:hypothetical protein